MFGEKCYHSLIKKYVSLFGSVFNDIVIERVDSSNATVQTIKVPIGYGPKEKYITRTVGDPNNQRLYQRHLPRMAFEIKTYRYANDRKLNTMGVRRTVSTDSNNVKTFASVPNPVPYDIHFKLEIMTKTVEDGLRIVEQILPYFTPDLIVKAKLLDEIDDIQEIPIFLVDVSDNDDYEKSFNEERLVTWKLDFIMKAFFYGPVNVGNSGLILTIRENLFSELTATVPFETITITPGQTANGEPTNTANNSVGNHDVDPSKPYGIIVDISTNT